LKENEDAVNLAKQKSLKSKLVDIQVLLSKFEAKIVIKEKMLKLWQYWELNETVSLLNICSTLQSGRWR